MLQARGTVLLPAFLPPFLAGSNGPAEGPLPADDLGLEGFIRQRLRPDARELYAETHAEVDRLLLPLVLEYARGNIQQASHILGIARQTLRLKLRDLGLSVRRSAEVEEDDPP